MITKKTDNGNFSGKLDLRRYFLDRYPYCSVLDCCQGSKNIWKILQEEYRPKKYLGVDIKPKKGRLQVDSARILGQPGWKFDVIDIDTYGSPWVHWQNALTYGQTDMTIFLTIGLVKVMGGRISKELMHWLGIDSFDPAVPPSLAAKLNAISLPYCLGRAEKHNYHIVEALEAPPAKNARYIGVRITKKTL